MKDALDFVFFAAEHDLASFPLSAAHYIETYHSRDPGRRQRLGRFMAAISQFDTIVAAPDLLPAEIDGAVSSLAGALPASRPKPFGRGVAHALGVERAYLLDPVKRARFGAAWGETTVFDVFERVALVGPEQRLPDGDIQMPTKESAQAQLDFERETARRLAAWGHSPDRAHRLVLVQETVAMLPEINAALARYRVQRSCLESRSAMTTLIMSMPAKAAITRLRMRAHENQMFSWHIGDLKTSRHWAPRPRTATS